MIRADMRHSKDRLMACTAACPIGLATLIVDSSTNSTSFTCLISFDSPNPAEDARDDVL